MAAECRVTYTPKQHLRNFTKKTNTHIANSKDRYMNCALSVLKGSLQERWGQTFSRAYCDRTSGNGLKLKEGRFRLDPRKKF